MSLSEHHMLHALLKRPHLREALYPFFPKDTVASLKTLETGTADVSIRLCLSTVNWIDSIHYSWFLTSLQPLRKDIQQFFLSLLPSSLAQRLCSLLETPLSSFRIYKGWRPLFEKILKEMLVPKHIIPLPLLPYTELSYLLELSRAQLLQLIDLLAMHDLAIYLHRIIDQRVLKLIYATLNPRERQFLQYCSHLSRKEAPSKLNLAIWDGSQQQLRRLLHQQGLVRLGKALPGSSESFVWHFLHRLDTGRAHILQKNLKEPQDPSLTSYFRGQVLYILKRYEH